MPHIYRQLVLMFALMPMLASAVDYNHHPKAKSFINKMVVEHQFSRSYVEWIIGAAKKEQAILDAVSKPAEKTKPWHEYREIFVQRSRIEGGVAFWHEHAEVLQQVSDQYGVPAEVLIAIIGVETRYGGYMGNYRVIDALTTLGFDYPNRSDFFLRQLEDFFLMGREQQQDLLVLKGSYAGAMGYSQFIPSSYRSFAVDYDNDGVADIWSNTTDAIASVANYFKAHGWQTGAPVAERASRAAKFPQAKINLTQRPKTSAKQLASMGFIPLSRRAVVDSPAFALEFDTAQGAEYWLAYNNFYVITRYNRSRLYAMAVYQLSAEIAKAYRASLNV